jgi:hypothetical protein
MKQIVNTVNTIDFRDITNKSFVGIDWGHDHKAMVIQIERDKFTGLGNHSYCNLLDCWNSTTMQSYISNALSQGDYVKAYAFNDLKELLTWLTLE